MGFLRSVSIKTKLVAAFSVLLALVIANGAFGICRMSSPGARLDVMYHRNYQQRSISSRSMLRTCMEIWRAQMYKDRPFLMPG